MESTVRPLTGVACACVDAGTVQSRQPNATRIRRVIMLQRIESGGFLLSKLRQLSPHPPSASMPTPERALAKVRGDCWSVSGLRQRCLYPDVLAIDDGNRNGIRL